MKQNQAVFEWRKARDFGAVIGDTFTYIRSNYKFILKPVITIAGPFLLLAAIYSSIAQANAFNPQENIFSSLFVHTIISNIFILLATLLLVVVVHGYVKLDIEKPDETEIKTEEVWQLVKQNIWKCLRIIFLGVLILGFVGAVYALVFYTFGPIFFGFVLFLSFFLLLYIFFRYSLVFPAALIDDYSAIDSFGRSWNLAGRFFWHCLGIGFVFGMLVGMLSAFASIPATILTVISAMHGGNADINPLWKLLAILLQTVGTLLAFAGHIYLLIAYILQYLSAVEVTEGVGLLQRIENMQLKTEDERWGEETY